MGRLVKNPSMVENVGAAASTQIPGSATADPTLTNDGQVRWNETTNVLEYYYNAQWNTLIAAGLMTITKDSFTGDAIEDEFTMSETVVTATDVLVFVGGVFQNPAVSYTVDGSTTITFTSAPPNLEAIVVMHGYNEVA